MDTKVLKNHGGLKVFKGLYKRPHYSDGLYNSPLGLDFVI